MNQSETHEKQLPNLLFLINNIGQMTVSPRPRMAVAHRQPTIVNAQKQNQLTLTQPVRMQSIRAHRMVTPFVRGKTPQPVQLSVPIRQVRPTMQAQSPQQGHLPGGTPRQRFYTRIPNPVNCLHILKTILIV